MKINSQSLARLCEKTYLGSFKKNHYYWLITLYVQVPGTKAQLGLVRIYLFPLQQCHPPTDASIHPTHSHPPSPNGLASEQRDVFEIHVVWFRVDVFGLYSPHARGPCQLVVYFLFSQSTGFRRDSRRRSTQHLYRMSGHVNFRTTTKETVLCTVHVSLRCGFAESLNRKRWCTMKFVVPWAILWFSETLIFFLWSSCHLLFICSPFFFSPPINIVVPDTRGHISSFLPTIGIPFVSSFFISSREVPSPLFSRRLASNYNCSYPTLYTRYQGIP